MIPKGLKWDIYDFLVHTCPALLVDVVSYAVGLLKCKFKCNWYALRAKHKEIDGQIDALDYFTNHEWKFKECWAQN